MFLDGNKQFYYGHDVDTNTLKYGRLGSPSGHMVSGKNGVETSGSSTTVTAIDGTPFDPVGVGDVIVFTEVPDTKTIRTVATKTSGAEITVDSAIDLSNGAAFFFYPFRIGTTNSDGWHHVAAYSAITVHANLSALASTGGIDLVIEGGGGSSLGILPTIQETVNFAAVGTLQVQIDKVFPFLRVGVKAGTSAGAGDSLDVWAVGEMLQAK
jgi:hypothetical protein